jgi:hypothetical protein
MELTTLLTTAATGPLGAILGLGGSLLQKWLSIKEAREQHKMRMEEMEIASRIDLQKAEILFRQVVEEKSGESFKAAIEAQGQLRASHAWAKTAIALFRPGLTLALMVASTSLAVWFHDAKPELLEFIIVSMFTMSSVSVGYWFGVRTDEKHRVQAAFPVKR